MAKYNYTNNKVNDFIDKLPESSWDSFKAIIQKGQLVAKTSVQLALNTADRTARTISMAVVMRQASWLGIPKGHADHSGGPSL
ncbi:hypothetical protein UY3_15988 [Chelonia mydas]|uniref:Uncharacterized protein n=1 Tax=Chelonia mydas TaxID=8469 RepID=M7ANU8_CHEMY|nr:hypothetical protein UY3_15988 [Chelonia mydas]